MILLIVMFSGANNASWIMLYNVENLAGNKFINGMIFSATELITGIFAGLLISYTSVSTAILVCTVLGIGFNVLVQFVLPAGSILSNMALILAILGVSGAYNTVFVVVGQVLPIEQVGGAMVIICSLGTCASLMAPLVVIYPTPIPFLMMAAFMIIALTA